MSCQDEDSKPGLDSFVFSHDEDGLRPWRPNWVKKAFIDTRRKLGLPHFRLHDLRHFMATEMLNAGVAIPTVSARLSHARNSTTLNYYAHAVPSGDLHAAEMLAAILDAPTEPRALQRAVVPFTGVESEHDDESDVGSAGLQHGRGVPGQ